MCHGLYSADIQVQVVAPILWAFSAKHRALHGSFYERVLGVSTVFLLQVYGRARTRLPVGNTMVARTSLLESPSSLSTERVGGVRRRLHA